jgi:cytochrome b subunit of formate dehydrogenase
MRVFLTALCAVCFAAAAHEPLCGQEDATGQTQAGAQPQSYQETVAAQLARVPVRGSQIAAEANYCATCHTEPALWGAENLRLFFAPDVLQHDIHWRNGVACSDCHGGRSDTSQVNTAHAREEGFRATLAEIQPACAHCHAGPANGLLAGLHARAGRPQGEGNAAALACADCHGPSGHGIRAAGDPASPLFLTREVALCGRCHAQSHDTYVASVHGRGLFESGLAISATCSDCHDPHQPLPTADERSQLHPRNVVQTCGRCHLFIQERLEASVHRWEPGGNGQGGIDPVLGGAIAQRPVCTSCHMGHDIADPRSAGFRAQSASRCGNCHARLSDQFRMSVHGQLTNLGHGPAAKCSDCHGSHDVLPIENPQSRVFGARRVETCRQCHSDANANFADFDPHADHHDPTRSLTLHYAYVAMEVLLYSVFGFFGLHTLLWFFRSIIHRVRHGRPRRLQPGEMAYVRFERFHRTLHVIVIVSFLGLALTGLPLKYSEQPWAQQLASALGGFESTSFWHRVCALMTAFYFVAHLTWLIRQIHQCRRSGMSWRTILFGPDSMAPNARDFHDLLGMGRWFFGLGKKPVFERWTYWEKFDYWAVFWGVAIIGTSGLLLWFPEFFCRFLPGQALNVAKVIHSEEALLATGFIFTIHFFNTHLRAERFPMDMSMLTGLVSKEEMQEERPELVERLRQAGNLDRQLMKTPSRRTLLWTMVGGAIAVAIGLALLVGILVGVF